MDTPASTAPRAITDGSWFATVIRKDLPVTDRNRVRQYSPITAELNTRMGAGATITVRHYDDDAEIIYQGAIQTIEKGPGRAIIVDTYSGDTIVFGPDDSAAGETD